MMRSLMWGVVVVVLAVPAQAQVSVSPPMVVVDAAGQASFWVRNQSDSPQEVAAELVFGYPMADSLGVVSMNYDDAATRERWSAEPRLRVFPPRFMLSPGGRQVVRLTALPRPGEADGVYWARIAVTSTPTTSFAATPAGGSTAGVAVQVRQTLPVLYRQGEVATGLRVDSIHGRVQGDTLDLRMDVRPRGNAPYLGSALVEVVGPDGFAAIGREFDVALYRAMPLRYRLDIAGGVPGDYTARVSFRTERNNLPISALVQAPPVVVETPVRVP